MVFNETKFRALQSAPQERVVEDFIPMPLFNENTSSLNSQSQSQPIISTPTSVLAPFPGIGSDLEPSSSNILPSLQQSEHTSEYEQFHPQGYGQRIDSSSNQLIRRRCGVLDINHNGESIRELCGNAPTAHNKGEHSHVTLETGHGLRNASSAATRGEHNLQAEPSPSPVLGFSLHQIMTEHTGLHEIDSSHGNKQSVCESEGRLPGHCYDPHGDPTLFSTRQVYASTHGDTEPFLFNPHTSIIQQEPPVGNAISCDRRLHFENHGKQHTEQNVCGFGGFNGQHKTWAPPHIPSSSSYNSLHQSMTGCQTIAEHEGREISALHQNTGKTMIDQFEIMILELKNQTQFYLTLVIRWISLVIEFNRG